MFRFLVCCYLACCISLKFQFISTFLSCLCNYTQLFSCCICSFSSYLQKTVSHTDSVHITMLDSVSKFTFWLTKQDLSRLQYIMLFLFSCEQFCLLFSDSVQLFSCVSPLFSNSVCHFFSWTSWYFWWAARALCRSASVTGMLRAWPPPNSRIASCTILSTNGIARNLWGGVWIEQFSTFKNFRTVLVAFYVDILTKVPYYFQWC